MQLWNQTRLGNLRFLAGSLLVITVSWTPCLWLAKKSRLSLNQSGANFPALWAHYLLSLSLRLLVMSSWMFFLFSAQYIHRSLRWQRKTKIIHGSPANERKRAKKLTRRGIRKVSNTKFLFNWCLSCVEFSCTWAVRRFSLGHTQLKHRSRNVTFK